MQNKYVIIAISESGDRDFSCTYTQESAERIALEFAQEGYFPEVYKLGEHI